jgi:mannosyltransferase
MKRNELTSQGRTCQNLIQLKIWNFRNPWFIYGTVLFVFLLNILIKSAQITTNSLALDEPFSVFYAQMKISDIVHELIKGNNPPLWEIVLHFWMKFFGTGLLSVRFLPMIFSSITPIYVFLIGKRFFNYKTGLSAALLFSFSDYLLFFSHEARVYPFFCLLTTISIYHFLWFTKRPGQTRHLIILTFANILLCYAHYFGFFVLFIQFLFALFYIKLNRKIFYSYILSLIVFFIAYFPILQIYLFHFKLSVKEGTWLSPVKADSWFFVLGKWTNNRVNLIIFLVPLLGSLFLLLKKSLGNFKQYLIHVMLYSWFWIPFLIMFFISFRIPMFFDRYLIYMSPAFFLILPVSLRLLKLPPVYRKIIISIFIALMIVSFKFNVTHEREVDKVVAKVKEMQITNMDVYLCPPWSDLNFMYYYNREVFENPYSFSAMLTKKGIFPIYNYDWLRKETLAQKKPLIFVDFNSQSIFSGNTILETLKSNYKLWEKSDFSSNFSVYYFHQ